MISSSIAFTYHPDILSDRPSEELRSRPSSSRRSGHPVLLVD